MVCSTPGHVMPAQTSLDQTSPMQTAPDEFSPMQTAPHHTTLVQTVPASVENTAGHIPAMTAPSFTVRGEHA